MDDWLVARARATPDKIAYRVGEQQVTFAEFQTLVTRVTAALSGIRMGERVAVFLPSSLEAAAILFALMRRGAILIPINTRLTPHEMRAQMDKAGWTMVVCTEETRPLIPPDVTAEIVPFDKLPPPMPRFAFGAVDLESPFVIVHTSGTSGTPKGAVLTYGNFFMSATASAYRLGHQPDDVWLCALPLFHVGGLSILIRACLYGITVDLHPRFDVDAVNAALSSGAVSLVSLVPTMLYRLLDARKAPWSARLRLVLLGGAAASDSLLDRCRAERIPVATTYGLTEAASQVATAPPEIALSKPGTVGKPLLLLQVRIADADGETLPPGEIGEVLVRGSTVMQGYIHDPEATNRVLRDGDLFTGDLGYLDEDGDLFVVQRRADLILTGGENVYPAEVEAVLRGHPAVSEAVVVGVADAEWGQRVAAVVQIRPGADISADDLIAYARQHLAGYKIPRRIRLVDALPQNASGKIDRRAVVASFEEA